MRAHMTRVATDRGSRGPSHESYFLFRKHVICVYVNLVPSIMINRVCRYEKRIVRWPEVGTTI